MVFNAIDNYLAKIGAALSDCNDQSENLLGVVDKIKPVVNELTQAYAMLEKMIKDDPSQKDEAKEVIIEMSTRCNSVLDFYTKQRSKLLETIETASENNIVLPESLYKSAQDLGIYVKKMEDIAEKYKKYTN